MLVNTTQKRGRRKKNITKHCTKNFHVASYICCPHRQLPNSLSTLQAIFTQLFQVEGPKSSFQIFLDYWRGSFSNWPILMSTQVCIGHIIWNWKVREKIALFPTEQNPKLTSDSSTPIVDPLCFHQLVERLFYFTITRPDITYTVHILSQFMKTLVKDIGRPPFICCAIWSPAWGKVLFFLHRMH